MAAKIHSSTHHEESSSLLPHCNADGAPVVPMDEELKYRFDVKGWVLLPALIPEEELVAIRAHQHAFLYDRESLPPEQRDNHVRCDAAEHAAAGCLAAAHNRASNTATRPLPATLTRPDPRRCC
jgi:hypothetical protein